MILHYLHIPPSEDVEEFFRQARMAAWMERRLNPKPKEKGPG